nr:hypothetical protein CFP56_76938 [Quercus suber]
MGKLNPMELQLNEDESKIEEKLYKAFGGHTALPSGQRAKFSSWISTFKKSSNCAVRRAAFLSIWMSKCIFNCEPVQFIKPFTFGLAIKLSQGMSLPLGTLFLGCLYLELDQLHYDELASSPYHIVDSGVNIVMLQAFAWERSRSYINIGKSIGEICRTKRVILIDNPDGEDWFFGFKHGLPLLMKWMTLKVRSLPVISSLDTISDFIWMPYAYIADGFFCSSPFPCTRPGSQMFNLGEDSKVLNFLLITSPSLIPCLNSLGFSLVRYNPHKVSRQFGLDQDVPVANDMEYDIQEAMRPLLHSSAMEYWRERGENVLVPKEWSKRNKIMEVPEPEPDENKTPSKRARDETPLAGSISRRTRSKREPSADGSKKGRSKSPVTVLTDSLVKGTSPAPIAPAVEVVGPSSVISIGGAIFPMSLDAKAKKYRRKTTAHKTKAVESDIGSSSNELPH